MKNIEIKILNPQAALESEKMMVCTARLTQKGHKIKNMKDFMELYHKDYSQETSDKMAALPHPTIQKFGLVNIVIVGASRRFLAQITRHQNEVKFMSASLQYSDYSGEADFVVPYGMYGDSGHIKHYLDSCKRAMKDYEQAIQFGLDNDSAGYMAPQGLANILVISATPFQWKHMISQRTCRRNTAETRYVMLRIWEQLNILLPSMFRKASPPCVYETCPEGHMSCGIPIMHVHPASIIDEDFPLLLK